jgi:inhibitor of cysteine peptidase
MKKLALAVIILLIVAASTFTACAAPKANIYIDETRTIFTKVGEEFTIAVPANPTTGYQWKESHDASLLNLVGSEYKPSKQAKGVVGAGGTQYFKFRALKPGMTRVDFSYQRPTEGIIVDTKAFNIVVE